MEGENKVENKVTFSFLSLYSHQIIRDIHSMFFLHWREGDYDVIPTINQRRRT